MKNNNRKVTKSKKSLKDALLSLMKKKDFNKITITDLINHADLNRGTFYKHYQTKEELLNEIIDEVIEDLIHSFREPYLHTSKFFIRELTSSTIKIFKHVEAYSNFYTTIINSNALPGFQNKICDVLKEVAQHDLEIVNDQNKNIDPVLLSSYHAYALFGLIVEWVKMDFKYSPNYMAKQLIEILNYDSIKSSRNIIKSNL
ncbi:MULTISPECIES: TetR/AcrR family transcriptional regulator [Bacillus]|uniref:TetR/AcrR family transcriptional regulator n=1 Tax=Bacillus TaxID=1386 RepID=UPI0002EB79AE|nr:MULTISPECIES: TetR/AcrR family transcriptional regulator [Bacillus]